MHPERFARQAVLEQVGEEGQKQLAKRRVLVVGAGGLGAPVILYLGASGIGHVDICEPDYVEPSNLPRQVLYTERDLGRPKAPLASAFARSLGAWSLYTTHPLESANVPKDSLLAREYDVIVDCTDRWKSHDAVIAFARQKNVPVVHGSIQGLIGRVMTFTKETPCWRCLHPEKPSGTKEGPRGTLGPVCGVIGSLMAFEALRILLGHGPQLAGQVLVYQAMTAETDTFLLAKDPACPNH